MYRARVTLKYRTGSTWHKVEHKLPVFYVEARDEREAKSRAVQIALSALDAGGPVTGSEPDYACVIEQVTA